MIPGLSLSSKKYFSMTLISMKRLDLIFRINRSVLFRIESGDEVTLKTIVA